MIDHQLVTRRHELLEPVVPATSLLEQLGNTIQRIELNKLYCEIANSFSNEVIIKFKLRKGEGTIDILGTKKTLDPSFPWPEDDSLNQRIHILNWMCNKQQLRPNAMDHVPTLQLFSQMSRYWTCSSDHQVIVDLLRKVKRYFLLGQNTSNPLVVSCLFSRSGIKPMTPKEHVLLTHIDAMIGIDQLM